MNGVLRGAMKRIKSFDLSDQGFGLTELAVAVLVLGIVLVGLFPLMVDSIHLAIRNSEAGQANRAVASNINAAGSVNLGGTCVSGSFTGTTPKGGLFVQPPEGFVGDVIYSCSGNPDGLVTVEVQLWKIGEESATPLSAAVTKIVVP